MKIKVSKRRGDDGLWSMTLSSCFTKAINSTFGGPHMMVLRGLLVSSVDHMECLVSNSGWPTHERALSAALLLIAHSVPLCTHLQMLGEELCFLSVLWQH